MTTRQAVHESRIRGARGEFHLRVWPAAVEPVAVVLFLHGLGEHGGLHEPLAHRLNAEGIEVWAPDQIGHGLSDGTRVLVESLDALADDAELILERIAAGRPGVPLILAGHSLGSAVTLFLAGTRAAAAPARALVLAGAGTGLSSGESGLRKLLAEQGIDPMSLRKDPGELCGNAEYAERLRNDPLVWSGGLRPQTLDALEAGGERIAELIASGAITRPVLFIHGEADDLAPASAVRAAAGALPNARARIFPGDLHNVLAENDRAQVHGEIAEFVLAAARD
ncbi:alpha/beta fold hydrolase [Embleya scabrispora]|uniref:alpha/beta fold hydrolase n=1 Tax=Embleya scabrispora TaxID=159449 RepID=UPI00036EE07B|nr:alpha/beta fold hydrolase [Embleya scabrispora]MYS87664.1 alpha/beta fold hydrolase [Streptomyces sp. SID5474]